MWSASWAPGPAAGQAVTASGGRRQQQQRPPAAVASPGKARAGACGLCPAAQVQHVGFQQQQQPVAGRRQQLVGCRAAKEARTSAADTKEAHKIFDEVCITVKSGDGGNGELVEAGRGKYVRNLKYHPGANQPKQIWLSASDPADGADGADVVLVCDPSRDSLLHLHQRKAWTGAKGAQGNPAVGSAGPKRSTNRKKAVTPPLEIPVPPGTVVKRKSSGQVLGELLQPGQRLVVAEGGKGGSGVRAPSRLQKQQDLRRELKNAAKSGGEVVAVEDINWRDDSRGLPGRQLGLHLLLRVVADVGIVGFPNAGKSSLLSALTRAQPEVAPYPFTTLMPNLGVMSSGGSSSSSEQAAPVLADLPGLIEGAHTGRGLGRMFLRHLRRTRLLLHVVDASAADPGTDYLAVREELRMYNPDYVSRPHVVALNKMDLEDAGALRQEVADEVMAAARQLQQTHAADVPGLTAPAAIVACSAVSGEGVQELAAAIQAVLQQPLSSGSLQQDQQQEEAAAALSAAVAAAVSGFGQQALQQQLATEQHQPQQEPQLQQQEESARASSDEADADDDDEPSPEPLAADDPDAWLFELSEDQLLAMMEEDAEA